MLWSNFEERVIDLRNTQAVTEVKAFLSKFGLTFDGSIEYTMALFQNNKLVATGSLCGEVLRNIAVEESLQGEGVTATVVSHLMREAGTRGRYHYFIFTKPEKAYLFSGLGFTEIAQVAGYAALLEAGMGSIVNYCRELARQADSLPHGSRAGLVVNCNPFTLGHQAVIRKAAKENSSVVVLVVSEERSLIPYDVRNRLVREGVAEYDNVLVLPAGKYIVSSATFPGYFTRGEETVIAQTRLDATIFAKYIAPSLGITCRYVGEEPYCQITNAYNQALKEILPPYGIEVRIMPRITFEDTVISASRVREMIRQGNWEDVRRMVPDTTYRYLISPDAAPIISRIRNSHARH